jgi:hypothetical protein
MNRKKLQTAIDECDRFIQRVKELPDPTPYTQPGMEGMMQDNYPKQQGAIRRASMDLSRALTELRKP